MVRIKGKKIPYNPKGENNYIVLWVFQIEFTI